MKRWILLLGACGVSVTSLSPSFAEEPEVSDPGSAAKGADAESTKAQAASSDSPSGAERDKPLSVRLKEVPKDPQGIQGLSPYWEAIARGDATTLALDFAASSQHYREAIALLPKHPEAHLRMAEISIEQGLLMQAQDFIGAALRFSDGDLRAEIHATLLLASLRESQNAHEDAIDSYRKYEALDGALPAKDESKARSKSGPKPPRVFTETAQQRIASLQRRLEMEKQYAVVAARIKKNVEAADQATGADAAN